MKFYHKIYTIVLATGIAFQPGCKKFLDTELNNSVVTSDNVFGSDQNATGVMLGVYKTMLQSVLNGGIYGMVFIGGLSSDEFNLVMQYPSFYVIERNNLQPDEYNVESMWNPLYQAIYQANDIMESVDNSPALTEALRLQLKGESLFARAISHFYLANMFGDVPIVLTSNYKENAHVTRQKAADVYQQAIVDLKAAITLLKDDYVGKERTRVNKAAAEALLARVYLYAGEWENAEATATTVIGKTSAYTINQDLSKVFTKDSKEVLWQLASEFPYNTQDGGTFIVTSSVGSSNVGLTQELLDDFEAGDERFNEWTLKYEDTVVAFIHPYKYRIAESGIAVNEHYVVLRLAEQYLIRAEARARRDNLSGAISDVDVIRDRASLPLIADTRPGISKADLLIAIAHERRIELFSEGGHRWFDLKRTKQADAVLSALKAPDWSANDTLFPIPARELLDNPNLGEQNKGY